MNLENLERHVKNRHPRADVDVSKALTAKERREVRRKVAAPRPKMTSRGKTLIVVIAILVAFILLVAIWNPFRGGPGVGDAAPDFTVDTCASGSTTLSTRFNSATVTVFELMDVHCEVCQNEAPVLGSVYETFRGQGVSFLSVSLIDWVSPADTCGGVGDVDSIQHFQVTYGTNWTYGMDTHRDVRNEYRPAGTPTTYVIDRGGVIRAKFLGPPPNGIEGYRAAIRDVLNA